jgi:hypothetical protein
MSNIEYCKAFLSLTKKYDFEELRFHLLELKETGENFHHISFRDTKCLDWIKSLIHEDRSKLGKAIAVYEDAFGHGGGSVTILRYIFSEQDPKDHETLDWITHNTSAYDYFSHGLSISTRNRLKERKGMEEGETKSQHKKRIAEKATLNLFGSVKRGDIKAVTALLDKGADPNAITPDGVSLVKLATSLGHTDITTLLKT